MLADQVLRDRRGRQFGRDAEAARRILSRVGVSGGHWNPLYA
jgi:hypothetical protein